MLNRIYIKKKDALRASFRLYEYYEVSPITRLPLFFPVVNNRLLWHALTFS